MKTIKLFFILLPFVAGLATLTSCKDDEPDNPDTHEWVDLGLPSGTLWATCNVGASAPEEYGNYFAWGETKPKEAYSWGTYKWCKGSYDTLTKYCTQDTHSYGYNGFTDGKTELDPEDDAAYVNWGPQWRMPSWEQIWELTERCTWTQTSLNGVNGHLFIGPNGNTIFFPDAGKRWGEWLDERGWGYWSRTLYSDYSCGANGLCWATVDFNYLWENFRRSLGRSVRAVRVSHN